ncbi:glycosyltransferase family 2 protein [Pseudocolwellia sp. AS88]|uniref:glycosyltransferase family 2 protein n=1 Tax=Pseudocolwellia sp. AS88 TaxID=3063958 RepID=UPI0026EBFFD1|nr:glycosyltransferase family 2 protein [Pseudocolwellia sp. AS88]MDO7085032.1 glycosyltransferase family 2 protein [Pseudocolwellia sp. AS88]
MSIFISVVSHGHGELIKRLACLSKLAKKFTVVVKINQKEPFLVQYLEENNIKYINEHYGIGFGHNNNVVYCYCKAHLSMKNDDHFLVFNPDVISDEESIDQLIQLMLKDNIKAACVNLFKDSNYLISDNSIRNFPNFTQFVKSFLGMGNSSIINKDLVEKPIKIDWAAGSFLAFKASHYARLKGFDEGYFMYCEDIDICYRSKLLDEPLIFYPQIKILHLAEHANRTILSKHFYWHLSSVVRFLLSKRGLTTVKSSIS